MSATSATAATAPIQHVRVGDHEIAYREIGSGRPLVLLQRFRGTIDHWDPQFLDALATRRRVVTFDAPGVGGSTEAVPQTISGMANDAAEFAAALDLGRADWLGWSMGGMEPLST
jgi:pimeloyl-ACP methyl ester carboxylesterase